MRLTMRIYKRHDIDLLAFYFASGDDFDIKSEIKDIIRAYIKGKHTNKKLPELECPPMASLPPKVNFHIPLDKKEDADIIAWLNTIRAGKRNNLIKNIFRTYYPPIIAPYYTEAEYEGFKLNERR